MRGNNMWLELMRGFCPSKIREWTKLAASSGIKFLQVRRGYVSNGPMRERKETIVEVLNRNKHIPHERTMYDETYAQNGEKLEITQNIMMIWVKKGRTLVTVGPRKKENLHFFYEFSRLFRCLHVMNQRHWPYYKS